MLELSSTRVMRDVWRGTAICALAALGLAAGTAARAGQEEQTSHSLGEIARRLRAQKPTTPAAVKTWTNENIPTNPFGISVVGPPPPPPEAAAAPAAAAPGAAPTNPKTETELESEIAAAQEKLDTLEKELDLAKRDFLLQQQGYYQNPMAVQDPQIQAALARAQQQIDAKQQDVDIAKGKLAELERALEDAKKNPPAQPKMPENPSQN